MMVSSQTPKIYKKSDQMTDKTSANEAKIWSPDSQGYSSAVCILSAKVAPVNPASDAILIF